YSVPGLPADYLEAVAGRGGDIARAERAVLTFEYWDDSHATPRWVLHEMLRILPETIDARNADAFVSLLVKRNRATDFFNLLNSEVDYDEALRRFLLANGLFTDTAVQYANFQYSPKLFFDGFVVGLGESFCAIVKDLPELA